MPIICNMTVNKLHFNGEDDSNQGQLLETATALRPIIYSNKYLIIMKVRWWKLYVLWHVTEFKGL